MEVKLTETNGTNVVDASDTRSNPTYIFYYTLSLIWHPTLTTGQHLIEFHFLWNTVFFSDNFIFYLFHLRLKEYFLGILPFLALSYMNLHIFLQIRQSRQVTSGRIRDLLSLMSSSGLWEINTRHHQILLDVVKT